MKIGQYFTGRRILAIILIPIVLLPLYTFIPPILDSVSENHNFSQTRNFDISFSYKFNRETGTFGDADMVIDLTIRYPHGILIVDEPVEISGLAYLKNTTDTKNITSLSVYFDNAQEFPFKRDNYGFTKGAILVLNRIKNSDVLIGNITVVWTVEGTYHTQWAITKDKDSWPKYIGPAEAVAITVYPKSQEVQLLTNNAILYLTIATYFATIVASISTFLYLWDWKPIVQTKDNKKNNGNKSNNNTYVKNRNSHRVIRIKRHPNYSSQHNKKTRYKI